MSSPELPPSSDTIHLVSVHSIHIPEDPDRFRPGTLSIDELAASIHEFGLLQPIIVASVNDSSSFHLVAGHRRLLACLALGHTTIDAKIIDLPDDQGSSIRLTENIQREDLSPLEEAVAVSRLREALSLTQEDIAQHLGKGVSWVKKREALLRLPDDVMDSLQEGQVNPSVALELGRIDDDHVRKYYLQSAIDYGATQDVATTWVENYKAQGANPDIKDLPEITKNFSKAVTGHKLPCYVCEYSFLLKQLSNAFLCPSCFSASAGAARHLSEEVPS